MHTVLKSCALAGVLSCIGLLGCEIVTEQPTPVDYKPASHVVINEVFTLPPTSQAPYSWIEFLNPTTSRVDIADWLLEFTTTRQQTITTMVVDSLLQFRTLLGSPIFSSPQFGRFRVPFAKAGDLSAIGIRDTVVMEPNDLFTIVNNEDRLLDHHTAWGQGASTMHRERRAFASVDSVVVIERVRGDSIIVTVYQTYYSSQLESTDQLLLVDNNGRVVDVVRYGNYTYPGPGTDPYPSNQSIGIIPEFQSIARYAGGYFTGNTANDFYVTNSNLPPIPHWYSQRIYGH